MEGGVQVSKRHQSSRRKSYGKRLHEVHERSDRHRHHEDFELELDAWGPAAPSDPLAFVDPRSPRMQLRAS
jgi:hypothetical protein